MSTRAQHTVDRLNGNTWLQLPLPPVTAAGDDLSGDHPVFALVPEALEELRTALDRSETHYADVPGIEPLRARVAEMLNSQGLSVDAGDGLIITHGEQEGRFLAIHTLVRLGYRIVLPNVVHPGAAKTAAIALTDVHRVPLDMTTMAPDLTALRAALAGGKTAVYVESPNRLTGKAIDRKTVDAIADAVRSADGIVIWDACLATWVPDSVDVPMIGALPGMADRTLTLGTLWSGAGVEGWLAAYLAGPPALFGQARSFKQIIAICTTTPAQWGVLGAMRSGEAVHRKRLQALAEIRREAVTRAGAGVLPGDAVTVVAVRRPKGINVAALGGRPMAGDAFGAPEILRFTVTPEGNIVDALTKLSGGKTSGAKTPAKARTPQAARPQKRAATPKRKLKPKPARKRAAPKGSKPAATAKGRRRGTAAKAPARKTRATRTRATKTRRGGRR